MRKFLTGALILIIILSICGILFIYYKQYSSKKAILDLRPEFTAQETANSSDSPKADFEKLLKTNPDFTAWLTVHDTNIDLPIMKNSENPLLYLDHDFYREQDENGLPFLDERNETDFSDEITIAYGHNMKSGMIFHDLEKYGDQSYFNEHRKLSIYTEDGEKEYTVIAYIEEKLSNADSFDYNYYTDFSSQEEKDDFIKELLKNSYYPIDTGEVDGKMLILSTCDNITLDGRIALVAMESKDK